MVFHVLIRLWLDLLASFPFNLILYPESYFDINTPIEKTSAAKAPQILRILKIMRFIRFTRLIRLLKLKKILIRFEEFFVSDFFILIIQFTRLLMFVLLIAHWGACFWYLIGYTNAIEMGTSWLIITNLLDTPIIERYISSLYFYITMMTTVGYGDIRATTSSERIYCMCSMLIGCGVFAYVIGSVGSVLSLRYDAETIFKQKIMFVNQYLVNKNIHQNLRTKVRRYLEHILENKKELKTDEDEVLSMLNQNLRDELQFYLNTQLLKKFVIISKYEEYGCLLTRIMKEETLNPGENIFMKGDYSLKIYFINSGTVYITDKDIVLKQLSDKAYFGEIGFFGGVKRTTSADSMSFLNVSYILLDLFKEVAYKYRQIKREEYNIIENNLNEIRLSVRKNDYKPLMIACYLCDSQDHISINCYKLKIYEEFVKLNFRQKKMSMKEKRKLFDSINRINYKKSNSRRANRKFSKISLPSFSKNTHQDFFSYESETVSPDQSSSNNISSLQDSNINQEIWIGDQKFNENDILKINKL